MTVERHKILGGKIAGNGDAEREDKGIPVSSKCFARIADVRDARHVGGKDAHAHHPSGDGVPGRSEFISRRALLEERAAKHHYAQREDEEDDEIYQMHSLPSLIGSALRASCILARSGVSNL